ncbi:MAG: ABC transporter ATP-binding protein, partial [Anaerolineae bacterium]
KIPIKRYWHLLHTYLRPQRRRMILLAILLGLKIASRLVNPQIIRAFLDQAMAGAATPVLLRQAVLFFMIAAATQVLTVVSVSVSETVAWTATNALRLDLLRHCLRLDMAFHKAHRPGELTERIDTDVDALSNFFSRFVISVIGNGVLAIGVLVLIFVQGWQYGVVFTVYAIVGLLVLMRLKNVATPFWTRLHEMQAQFYGFLGEQFSGTEDIRANGAQGYVMRRLYEYLRRWLPINRNASLAAYSGWMTNAALVAAGEMLSYALAGYYFFRGQLTIGEAYLLGDYMGLLFGQIAELRWQITDLQHAEAGIERIQALFDLQPRLVDGLGGPLPEGALSIAFRDVSFAYDDAVYEPTVSAGGGEGDEDAVEIKVGRDREGVSPADGPTVSPDGRVLQNLAFSVAPGRVLGLLGRTGSGKTTLARLLLRLYDPTEGQIRLGGVPLPETSLRDIRRRVALVTQEVQLFQASVRDNLTLFDPTIPDAVIEGVLEQLGLGEWLAALPEGLETEMSSEGSGLSAGQAQLLAFARVFLSDPDLVILDEASSRLDPATEQLIERAVDLLLAERTGVVIAHRLNTVQRADEILILEDGCIREHGPCAELAADPESYFHHFLQTGMQDVLA